MPEITLIEIGVLAGTLILGVLLGWLIRGGRCAKEKIVANAGWQEQLESQRTEHDRLASQNQSLMEQISQYQASMKDSNNRAKELSDSLKEAFERRDNLQRQLKEIRGELDVAIAERDNVKAAARDRESRDEVSLAAIRDRDNKIFRLSRELTAWQNRVPPLVERFRERDLEAQELEVELQQAHERVAALEAVIGPDHTRIEPVDPNSLANGLNASNDPLDEASGEFDRDLVDQNASYNEEVAEDDEIEDYEAELLPESVLGDDDETVQADAIVNDHDVSEDATDDLKQIKGVGPAIEKTLNDLGIYRFNQIAEMSEYDIDRVAQRLKGFRSRIYREDWVGQARSLQYQKNNDLV
jgi:predicted flap endonuclease-1-like 5' DNA nuclease/predicted  nucleic acid-binding Zn-ribbon protein